MESRVFDKYYCAVCGKSYDSFEERAMCESKCIADRKQAEADKKRNEYEAKRKESAKNITDTLNELEEMIANHFEQYRALEITKTYPYVQHVCGNYRWWF